MSPSPAGSGSSQAESRKAAANPWPQPWKIMADMRKITGNQMKIVGSDGNDIDVGRKVTISYIEIGESLALTYKCEIQEENPGQLDINPREIKSKIKCTTGKP